MSTYKFKVGDEVLFQHEALIEAYQAIITEITLSPIFPYRFKSFCGKVKTGAAKESELRLLTKLERVLK